jgi:hypothetical protein
MWLSQTSSLTISATNSGAFLPFCCLLDNGMNKARSVIFKSTIRMQATTGRIIFDPLFAAQKHAVKQPHFRFSRLRGFTATEPAMTVIGISANDLSPLMRKLLFGFG